MQRYRYGACNSTGTQLWSRIYDDWDECYADYVQAMQDLRDIGPNLASYKWRGTFNLEQATLLAACEAGRTLDIIWAYERLNDTITAWVYVYRDGEIQFASHAGYHEGEFTAERACIAAAEGMAKVARISGATVNVKELGA